MLSEKVKGACGVAILLLCLASGAKWIFPNSGGPPLGRTGSPGDSSADCTGCHSGSSQSNSSSLSLSGLPADGWRANTTYNLTLSFSPPTGSRFGFEMTAEKSGGSKMGSWTKGIGNEVISTNWLGHSSAGSQNSWSFSWTAPSAGNGTVTFYAVGNAANNNGGTSGDAIHLKSFALSEDVSSSSAPTKPAFSGVVLSTSIIKWSWNAQDNVTAFEVRPASGGILASLVGATTFWLETNLQPATTYQRFVRAANPLGSADSDSVILATPQSASAVAANTAATVIASDQKTSVEVPSGALGGAGSILISLDPETKPIAVNSQDITAATNKLSSSVSLITNSLREFSAVIGDARKTDNFGAAVTITLPYTDNDSNDIVDNTSINAGALSIYSLDETAKSWTLVTGSTLNRSAKTVSAAVSHFSVFSLIGTTASSSLNSIKIFPNPFRPRTGATGIRFQNLTSEATIKIYSLSGELLATLNKTASDGNEKSWNATSDSGERLGSGVYLALVESSGEEKILKLAIER